MSKLRIVELFSGIGAWSKALENLNIDHEVVLAVDQDEYPMTVYNAIHGTNFQPIDISKLNENDVPNCDVIFYSPPCQSWSAAGKQDGFSDSRGVLFFDALRIIESKKPKYAIMENVKNLTSKKFQFEFAEMLTSLETIGYTNYWKILNAKDHGMVQNRERVFVVSIRNDISEEFKFPSDIPLNMKLSDVLEEDAQLPILHNIYGGFKEDSARVFEEYAPTIRTSAGGGHIPSVIVKGCSLRTRNYMGQPQQLEVRKDELSNAVTTVPKDYMLAILDDTYKGRDPRFYGDYSPTLRSDRQGFKIVHLDKGKWKVLSRVEEGVQYGDLHIIRQMTSLEAWRLMGFTDDDYYKAKQVLNDTYYRGKDKSNTRLYKMAGNSIVVNVVEEILKELLSKYIKSANLEIEEARTLVYRGV